MRCAECRKSDVPRDRRFPASSASHRPITQHRSMEKCVTSVTYTTFSFNFESSVSKTGNWLRLRVRLTFFDIVCHRWPPAPDDVSSNWQSFPATWPIWEIGGKVCQFKHHPGSRLPTLNQQTWLRVLPSTDHECERKKFFSRRRHWTESTTTGPLGGTKRSGSPRLRRVFKVNSVGSWSDFFFPRLQATFGLLEQK